MLSSYCYYNHSNIQYSMLFDYWLVYALPRLDTPNIILAIIEAKQQATIGFIHHDEG